MSRIAKKPLFIPNGVNIEIDNTLNNVIIKGPLGIKSYNFNNCMNLYINNNYLNIDLNDNSSIKGILGTTYVLLSNFIIGVLNGFELKLILEGIGYKAKICDGNILELSVGFSHIIRYFYSNDINIKVISNTEIVIKGICKQTVGQVAYDIYSKRPVEPYKGKGIRYFDKKVFLKKIKKK